MKSKKLEPNIRFPEFSSDWKESKLDDFIDFYKGKLLSKQSLSEEGNPCILYGELYTKYSEIISHVYSRTKVDSQNLFVGLENDILIPS